MHLWLWFFFFFSFSPDKPLHGFKKKKPACKAICTSRVLPELLWNLVMEGDFSSAERPAGRAGWRAVACGCIIDAVAAGALWSPQSLELSWEHLWEKVMNKHTALKGRAAGEMAAW